jgi:nucleoside 2-deoxyribosyltransferase
MDCTRSNLVLMNLLGADRVSVGTMIEVGWADAARNPIIVAMEPGNVHEHPMVSDCAGYIVPTLDEAINLAVSILSHLTVDLGIRAGEAA